MSPADLHDWEPAGLTQIERILRKATTEKREPPPCNTKCGELAASDCTGFCAKCHAELPPALVAQLNGPAPVRGLLVATEWLVELRKEAARE